jgi:hypothetical protein
MLALTKSSPLLAQQWGIMYNRGKVTIPPLTLLPAALFGLLAYRNRSTSGTFGLYVAAAVLGPTIVPYTLLVMGSTNNELEAKADSAAKTIAEEAVGDNTHALVDRWGLLNLGRAAIYVTTTVVGLWATLGSVEVVGVESFEFLSGANRLG